MTNSFFIRLILEFLFIYLFSWDYRQVDVFPHK